MSVGVAQLVGPISGRPNGNWAAFQAGQLKLQRMGWRAINPRQNPGSEECFQEALRLRDRYREGPLYRAAMKLTFRQVLEADRLFVLPGWRESSGAVAEALLGQQCGIPIHSLETMQPISEVVLTIIADPVAQAYR